MVAEVEPAVDGASHPLSRLWDAEIRYGLGEVVVMGIAFWAVAVRGSCARAVERG